MVDVIKQATGKDYVAYHGDCCEVVAGLPDESIGYSIFSPPFASLYVYSDSDRDMGNCKNMDEFFQHFRYLIVELHRVLKPGRLVSVHCMNLPTTIQHHGEIGIEDFRGDIVRAFKSEGFVYHSEVCIWKDPVTAMQRTKAIGLLHKQVVKDSCMSRQGIPDFLCTFRKRGVNPEPVAGEFDRWIGDDLFASAGLQQFEKDCESYRQYCSLKTKAERDEWADCGGITTEPVRGESERRGGSRLSIDIWQRYASPVWMDINPSRTLQYTTARDPDDERHICPLQLDVIERGMEMWSNEGDTVLSPFMGIGSEGHVALLRGRRFVGVELKKSYFDKACQNLERAAHEFKQAENKLFE